MPIYSFDGVSPRLPDVARYWLAPGGVLIGDVRLQSDVGIWFGAVLRADNEYISVGAGSNVQDNCVIHSDPKFPVTIGDYCTIGHGAIIHGCTIGDSSLVGMGATILNGARVGRNCLIAANALVPEGKIIPDNSFVKGVPGTIAGELDAARIEHIANAAQWYIARSHRYRDRLVAVG